MSVRKWSLSTTALVALGAGCIATVAVPGVLISAGTAAADDLPIPTKASPLPQPAQSLPAVDDFNAKWEAVAGAYDEQTYVGSKGSLTGPIGRQFGFQVDALAADFGASFLGSLGGHLFWRDPSVGLLGVYASDSYLNRFGGLNVTQVAPEFEGYWGRWSLQGIAGVEFGNSTNATVSVTPTGGLVTTDIRTRFLDKVSLSYYLTDDFKVGIGHRYEGGLNALALDAEYAFGLGKTMASLFVEGNVGGQNFRGVWGGLRFYFGQHDKTLIRRQREDDPINWLSDVTTLVSSNNQVTHPAPPPPHASPPPPPLPRQSLPKFPSACSARTSRRI